MAISIVCNKVFLLEIEKPLPSQVVGVGHFLSHDRGHHCLLLGCDQSLMATYQEEKAAVNRMLPKVAPRAISAAALLCIDMFGLCRGW